MIVIIICLITILLVIVLNNNLSLAFVGITHAEVHSDIVLNSLGVFCVKVFTHNQSNFLHFDEAFAYKICRLHQIFIAGTVFYLPVADVAGARGKSERMIGIVCIASRPVYCFALFLTYILCGWPSVSILRV